MVFGTQQNILYKDPEWGPMELGLNGSYILKVINPVNLLTNINSNADITRVEDVRLSVNNRIVACVMEAVNKLNVTFDEIYALFEFDKNLKNIILTASGGPFRGKTYDELKHITVKEALNHPNWTGWTNEAYRTITFENAPTGDLLTWLQANGTKQQPTYTFKHWKKSNVKVNRTLVGQKYYYFKPYTI